MKKKTYHLSKYLLGSTLSALAVVACAYLQYEIVQGGGSKAGDCIIPVLVGIFFGALITRTIMLGSRLKQERDIVLDKNRRIRSFTGTIVHDLKSPVAAINSLSGMIIEEDQSITGESKEYIELIHQSSSDMLENIGLILDKTKLDSGLEPDDLEVGNPYYTIQSVIDKFIVTAVNKSISIQRLVESNLPEITYDKAALDRILSNLISNAIKYSPPNTQVKIITELFSDRLKIIVRDQGLGMTAEDIDNAFQEFKTLSARPTGNETSSGLGLSIVKQLVNQIGGDVVVKSEGRNKGSSFEISLKLATPPD